MPGLCQVHEAGGRVLGAGPSAHRHVCDLRTQQALPWLHAPAQGPPATSVPSAAASLRLASNAGPSLLVLEAPSGMFPTSHLPGNLHLALNFGKSLQTGALTSPRTQPGAPHGGCPQGPTQPVLGAVRPTGPSVPCFCLGPGHAIRWPLDADTPSPGQLSPPPSLNTCWFSRGESQ